MSVTTFWNADDQAAVQEFHAPLFRKWKRRRGYWAVADIPGFLPSLQALHDYGYSLTDIAAMWGVTRERVRQWFNMHGLERYEEQASVRVWDDDIACFYPVSRDEYLRRRAVATRANRKHAALAADVELVQRLADELGRPPLSSDISEAMYGPGRRGQPLTAISTRWGGPDGRGSEDCTYAEAIGRLYDAAGVPRPTRSYAQRIRRSEERSAA